MGDQIYLPPDTIVHDDMVYAADTVPDLWDLIQQKVKSVWDKGITGKGVNVLVMDTGYTPHHHLPTPIEVRNFTTSNTTDVRDRNGHGNWCIGRTVGRDGVGMAPEAQLLVAKVLSDSGSGRVDWSMAARVWGAQKGAHVTSVSIGGGCMPTREVPNSMLKANELGTLLECDAAGNSGYNGRNTIDCPGKYREGFCIGSYRQDGKISNFSSGGREIDVAAPGERCISTSHRGSGWATMSGTSMATPNFAGLIALLVQHLRQLGYPDYMMRGAERWRDFFYGREEWAHLFTGRKSLMEAAFEDAGAQGVDPRFGLGKLLILEAINWIGDYENV